MKSKSWDNPGSPGIKILCFHCRGHRFDPWLDQENWDLTFCAMGPTKQNKIKPKQPLKKKNLKNPHKNKLVVCFPQL